MKTLRSTIILTTVLLFSGLAANAQCNWQSKIASITYDDTCVLENNAIWVYTLNVKVWATPNSDFGLQYVKNGDTIPYSSPVYDGTGGSGRGISAYDTNTLDLTICLLLYDQTNNCDTVICMDFKNKCAGVASAPESMDELTGAIIGPNPTTGQLNLTIENYFEECTVRQLSLTGEVMSEKNFQSGQHMQFDLLGTPGIYFLEIIADGRYKVVKVVKN